MQDNSLSQRSPRGGARPGAGRKRSDNARNIRASFNLSPLADAKLREKAISEGCSRNDLINRILENL